MKRTYAILLALLFSAAFLQAQVLTLPLKDESAARCPIQNTGEVRLEESQDDKQVYFSYHDSLTATNISSKPIVMLVETITIRFSSGHIGGGNKEFDSFFAPATEDLKPGKSLTLGSVSENKRFAPIRYSHRSTPSADVKVVYVQFDDGSDWGDRREATHALDARRGIWSALQGLDELYRTKGQDAFADTLTRTKYGNVVEGFMRRFRDIQQSKGTEAALAAVHETIGTLGQKAKQLNEPTP